MPGRRGHLVEQHAAGDAAGGVLLDGVQQVVDVEGFGDDRHATHNRQFQRGAEGTGRVGRQQDEGMPRGGRFAAEDPLEEQHVFGAWPADVDQDHGGVGV